MWRKSDERRIEKFFERARQEPTPGTLRARLQADVEARFAEPREVARLTGLVSRTLRAKPLLIGAAALVTLTLFGVAVGLVKRSTGLGVLAIVEAATAVRPSHMVTRILDGSGAQTFRLETWRCPDGKCYVECRDLISGTRGIQLFRRRQNISWQHELGTNEYRLSWGGHGASDLYRLISGDIDHGGLPALLSEDSVLAVRRKLFGVSIVSVRQTTAEWHGQNVRIFDIETTPAHIRRDDRFSGRSEFKYFLTLDLRRMVREVCTLYDENGERLHIQDSWPIEYDTLPPESLQVQIPKDAKATFRGREIDPVWEYMDQAERGEITHTVLALAEAWRNGDFEEFEKYYDFRAGLEYGVNGKFSPEEIRKYWEAMVTSQKGRWAEYQLIVDYGFGSAVPPDIALRFFSVYRKNPQSGVGWHLYREEPTEEPGIVVLARVKVTDHDGETRELGTQLFLRETHGEYQVILWRPPLA